MGGRVRLLGKALSYFLCCLVGIKRQVDCEIEHEWCGDRQWVRRGGTQGARCKWNNWILDIWRQTGYAIPWMMVLWLILDDWWYMWYIYCDINRDLLASSFWVLHSVLRFYVMESYTMLITRRPCRLPRTSCRNRHGGLLVMRFPVKHLPILSTNM